MIQPRSQGPLSSSRLRQKVTEENMAACETDKIARVPTLVGTLSMDILERLGMKLNPRHPMKDFRYLAGLMNYTYEMVRNLERQRNPTIYLLSEWNMAYATNGEARTVSDLIDFLKEMKRDDVVEILKPVEYTGKGIERYNFEQFFKVQLCSMQTYISV